MSTSVVSTLTRPDLVEVTVSWRWNEWLRDREPFEVALGRAKQATAMGLKIPQSFVLLVDAEPVGTASITAQDLEERPDLTPWLAGVFVVPKARGRGYAAMLVCAVEEEARRQSISTLWLYTNTAERIYARLGWRPVETILHNGKPSVLMGRDLLA
jgi:GNAT superfamily N-acetyltransferase